MARSPMRSSIPTTVVATDHRSPPRADGYTSVDPDHPPHRLSDVLRWALLDRLAGRREISLPGQPAPVVALDSRVLDAPNDPQVTWLGHSSYLLQAPPADDRRPALSALIDPVLSRRIGGFYRNYLPTMIDIDDLPTVDLLLISHAHYDHLDAPTIGRLDRSIRVVVPGGLGRFFRRRGFRRVAELEWWQAVDHGDTRITLVPARHWSRRWPWDMNRSLWGGFVVEHAGFSFYHAGDSAYWHGFTDISQHFPALDVAMIPIGAYEPGWFMEHSHMTPEQAAKAFLDCGAQTFIPMHWGAFQLTDESLTAPLDRLQRWWQEHSPANRSLKVPAVGETTKFLSRGAWS